MLHLVQDVWERDDDSQVYVHRGDESALELEFSKFHSLRAFETICL